MLAVVAAGTVPGRAGGVQDAEPGVRQLPDDVEWGVLLQQPDQLLGVAPVHGGVHREPLGLDQPGVDGSHDAGLCSTRPDAPSLVRMFVAASNRGVSSQWRPCLSACPLYSGIYIWHVCTYVDLTPIFELDRNTCDVPRFLLLLLLLLPYYAIKDQVKCCTFCPSIADILAAQLRR